MQALWLVYDGDCDFCRAIARTLDRTKLVPAARQRAFQHIEGVLAERLWNAGIQNEILVCNAEGSQIRSGFAGFLWIQASTRPTFWLSLLAWAPLAESCAFAYRLLAYNRQFLAPKDQSRARGACDPDFDVGYRTLWLLLLLGLALLATFGYGATLEHATGERAGWLGGSELVLALGLGWFLPSLGALRLPLVMAYDWLGHLASVLVRGSLVLLLLAPFCLLLDGSSLRVLQLGGLVLSYAIMVPALAKRVRCLGLGAPWFWLWNAGVALGLALATLLWVA